MGVNNKFNAGSQKFWITNHLMVLLNFLLGQYTVALSSQTTGQCKHQQVTIYISKLYLLITILEEGIFNYHNLVSSDSLATGGGGGGGVGLGRMLECLPKVCDKPRPTEP